MRRTKIVCTIGPASESDEVLEKLIDTGLNVARLNFSHGTHDSHLIIIKRIRTISKRKNTPVAILQDLAGPKIRIGIIKDEPVLLNSGQDLVLTSEEIEGDKKRVSVSFKELPEEVRKNDQILLADGAIELKVKKVENHDILCEVIIGGPLSSKKGINIPGRTLSISALTEKDMADLEFGLENDLDYVAMSFVRHRKDIVQVQKIMENRQKKIPIIAKIEKHEALDNIDEILEVVEGVMVARGDLAVETPLERVPIIQKMIIHKCNRAGKPVITATQMLKSMVDSPRPTRAEANDVANAVIDGTDAVMLSEESAVGSFPVLTVQTMSNIIMATESSTEGGPQRRIKQRSRDDPASIAHAVSHAAFEMAKDLKAAAILTPTQSGSTARIVSSYRPPHLIISLSTDEAITRRLALVWGVHPMLADDYFNVEEMIQQTKDKALASGLIKSGDTVVITAGVPIGVAGTTNLIKAEVLV